MVSRLASESAMLAQTRNIPYSTLSIFEDEDAILISYTVNSRIQLI